MRHVGIIGAGQLAAFMCQAARRLGDETTVLARDADDVAIAQADHAIIGDPADPDLVASLATGVDVITFDYEDIPADTLKRLSDQAECSVLPLPKTLMLLQNKAQQKRWLLQNGYPTAPFSVYDSGIDEADAHTASRRKYLT